MNIRPNTLLTTCVVVLLGGCASAPAPESAESGPREQELAGLVDRDREHAWIVVEGPLRAVAVTSATDAIAVGPAGLWLTWDGNSWSKQAAFTPQNLNGIAAYGNGSYVAVTAQGQIWKRTGKTWSQVGSSPFPLVAVTAAGAGKAWAVGQMGVVATEAGGNWNLQIGNLGNKIGRAHV